MDGLNTPWEVVHPLGYAGAVVLLSLAVRAAHSLLKAIRLRHALDEPRPGYWSLAWICFHGVPSQGDRRFPADYWYTFILGTMELATYPVLIATGAWAVIGAWIGLKTIAQWSVWTSDRATFNLFLIGNGTVVICAFFFLTPLVHVPTL